LLWAMPLSLAEGRQAPEGWDGLKIGNRKGQGRGKNLNETISGRMPKGEHTACGTLSAGPARVELRGVRMFRGS